MSKTRLEATFTPADFEELRARDLSDAVCVVFDILRATSSMVTGLANGARSFLPVAEIPEALRARSQYPESLLAGERDGLRITAAVSGGVEFHLGNSPREYTVDRVSGRQIITTTTNGTRALRACLGAREVYVGSFLNHTATLQALRQRHPTHLLLVCGGTFEEMAYEDILAAGAFAHALWPEYVGGHVADSALVARELFTREQQDLRAGLARSRNGARLLSRPDLAEDVSFCARLDSHPIVARMDSSGLITRSSAP